MLRIVSESRRRHSAMVSTYTLTVHAPVASTDLKSTAFERVLDRSVDERVRLVCRQLNTVWDSRRPSVLSVGTVALPTGSQVHELRVAVVLYHLVGRLMERDENPLLGVIDVGIPWADQLTQAVLVKRDENNYRLENIYNYEALQRRIAFTEAFVNYMSTSRVIQAQIVRLDTHAKRPVERPQLVDLLEYYLFVGDMPAFMKCVRLPTLFLGRQEQAWSAVDESIFIFFRRCKALQPLLQDVSSDNDDDEEETEADEELICFTLFCTYYDRAIRRQYVGNMQALMLKFHIYYRQGERSPREFYDWFGFDKERCSLDALKQNQLLWLYMYMLHNRGRLQYAAAATPHYTPQVLQQLRLCFNIGGMIGLSNESIRTETVDHWHMIDGMRLGLLHQPDLVYARTMYSILKGWDEADDMFEFEGPGIGLELRYLMEHWHLLTRNDRLFDTFVFVYYWALVFFDTSDVFDALQATKHYSLMPTLSDAFVFRFLQQVNPANDADSFKGNPDPITGLFNPIDSGSAEFGNPTFVSLMRMVLQKSLRNSIEVVRQPGRMTELLQLFLAADAIEDALAFLLGLPLPTIMHALSTFRNMCGRDQEDEQRRISYLMVLVSEVYMTQAILPGANDPAYLNWKASLGAMMAPLDLAFYARFSAGSARLLDARLAGRLVDTIQGAAATSISPCVYLTLDDTFNMDWFVQTAAGPQRQLTAAQERTLLLLLINHVDFQSSTLLGLTRLAKGIVQSSAVLPPQTEELVGFFFSVRPGLQRFRTVLFRCMLEANLPLPFWKTLMQQCEIDSDMSGQALWDEKHALITDWTILDFTAVALMCVHPHQERDLYLDTVEALTDSNLLPFLVRHHLFQLQPVKTTHLSRRSYQLLQRAYNAL